MAESRSGVSAFETRLAAMDRRLRELQEELAPAGEPAAERGDGSPPPPRASVRPGAIAASVPPERSHPRPDVLLSLYGRLLASMRELLSGYELVAGGGAGALEAAPGGSEVAVSAGPFSGTPALRDFERALSELPGVRAVALRGYDSEDRAVWDVQLR